MFKELTLSIITQVTCWALGFLLQSPIQQTLVSIKGFQCFYQS